MDMDAEPVGEPFNGLTKIEPSTFRGVDCALLAERYATYLLAKEIDEARANQDIIRPASPSSESV